MCLFQGSHYVGSGKCMPESQSMLTTNVLTPRADCVFSYQNKDCCLQAKHASTPELQTLPKLRILIVRHLCTVGHLLHVRCAPLFTLSHQRSKPVLELHVAILKFCAQVIDVPFT